MEMILFAKARLWSDKQISMICGPEHLAYPTQPQTQQYGHLRDHCAHLTGQRPPLPKCLPQPIRRRHSKSNLVADTPPHEMREYGVAV
jgi:hypothetical protein